MLLKELRLGVAAAPVCAGAAPGWMDAEGGGVGGGGRGEEVGCVCMEGKAGGDQMGESGSKQGTDNR